ncbi:methyl-accepting chemotaxis protein [Heliophilum fasciatum]|uniref:Methyl-accepting chemotaxis sensory transducer n=1 Tax=Heliophilum fasciatum TaxID=35700 RepID=A0A4V2SWX0_9FIRM|nr:methyl-accepting chemotaxis protein [Heliophilum fasciatum]MCW2278330.1 methyl-accepting chemotaxis protein [Heliophilum fasciatum]TCP63796.1 methyl-accepting chemotaxis sensory transducer [Heliophilum fasciatum]
MKWFKNLKIGVKLIVSFIIVAMIAGVVGIIGVLNINKIDKNYSDLYTNYGIALTDIADASLDYQRIRVNLRDLLLHKGQDRQIYVNTIKDLDKKKEESLARFEKSLQTDEAKKEFAKLKAAVENYAPLQQKVIDLALAGQEEQALAVLGEGKHLADEVNNGINTLFELKDNGGKAQVVVYSEESSSTITTMIIIVVIAVIIAIALGFVLSRMISNPIKEMVGVAEKIADGNLDVDVTVDTKDEIGILAVAFRQMTNNLNEVMSNISTASEQVSAGAKQVSDSSMSLSQGTTEQASSIEELTASLEEISSQTRMNADSASEANSLAEKAKDNAAQGNEQMKHMLQAMDDINDSSSNISKIIKVIDEIAFQTNILALNAAVEAARAGQHGKGFAVVAEEVRNLAARSANAAKETTAMIEGSIKKVEEGTKIANHTAEALNQIVEGVAHVAELVSNIAVASNEQASGIAQINQGIMQVSQVVQANSATSEESAAASEELASQAEMLSQQVARFRLRRTTGNGSYRRMEDLNPDVLRVLEQMGNQRPANDGQERTTNSKKIILSDREFGKY